MRYQEKNYSCSAACILNACKLLGIKGFSEAQIRKFCGTVKDGSTAEGIKQGLERVGLGWAEISEHKSEEALKQLRAHLFMAPAILLTERGNHWVLASSAVGDRVVFIDSQNNAYNRRENGVWVHGPKTIKRYWTPYEGSRYGIRIIPKNPT